MKKVLMDGEVKKPSFSEATDISIQLFYLHCVYCARILGEQNPLPSSEVYRWSKTAKI